MFLFSYTSPTCSSTLTTRVDFPDGRGDFLRSVGQFTRRVFVKTIHFDGIPSRSITVSDVGYEEIVALVTQHR